ncbi:MAG: ABC transporter ATP-binding protein [Acidimicrobiia bacterium]|nr:ABC transporter ATP-binding protein [Acidimicrobiia bacterium]
MLSEAAATPDDPAIWTKGLTRGFPAGLAVENLDIHAARGEVLALLGPNGAGKTTTVRLLNGILKPDAGSMKVMGYDPVTEGDAVRSRTGVLTEIAGIDDRLTTLQNLEVVARLRGFEHDEAVRRSMALLERFGMAERAQQLTQGFSTGQRKRVALARAMLGDPEVLFLDEPTSGLDPAGTRDVVALIGELAAEGRTILLATHFLGEASRLAHSMAVLHRGRLRAFGRPAELAADIFDGIGVVLDLGGPPPRGLADTLASVGGVHQVDDAPVGLALRVRDRQVVPDVLRAAAASGADVFEVRTHAPTLEDVYFAVEARIMAEEGAGINDAFLAGAPAYEATS